MIEMYILPMVSVGDTNVTQEKIIVSKNVKEEQNCKKPTYAQVTARGSQKWMKNIPFTKNLG